MKKIILSSESIKPALKKLALAVVAKPILPVLKNMLCRVEKKKVELITSDNETTVIAELDCESAGGDFEILIPFNEFSEYASLANAPITIELISAKKGRITINDQDDFELNSLEDASTFAKIPGIPKMNSLSFAKNFCEWLKVSMATSGKDENRPVFSRSILDIKKGLMCIVSTDTSCLFKHMISAVEAPAKDIKEQLQFSHTLIKSLDGFEGVVLSWTEKHIAVKSNGYTILSIRHQDKYPNYEAVITDTKPNLTFKREELANALHKVAIVDPPMKLARINLAKDKESITIISDDTKTGKKITSPVVCNHTSEVECIGVNYKKLLTLIGQVEAKEMRMHIDHPTKAILLSSDEDPDYLGLIMPLVIN